MLDPIKEIIRFNKEAGLLNKGYDDKLESSFLIEEALEGFDTTSLVYQSHDTTTVTCENPKSHSRYITSCCSGTLSDVDRLDKACDAVVFAIGSMAKLGLDQHAIKKALNIVMKANFTKLGQKVDHAGKLGKPADFVGPEAELQALLYTAKGP